jgi:hypothetical protein
MLSQRLCVQVRLTLLSHPPKKKKTDAHTQKKEYAKREGESGHRKPPQPLFSFS